MNDNYQFIMAVKAYGQRIEEGTTNLESFDIFNEEMNQIENGEVLYPEEQ